MAHTIAVSGKGGVGKSTLCAGIVRCLAREHGQSVLAVDADPNSTLGLLLGEEPERTVADIREDVLADRIGLSASMSKPRQIEYLIRANVVEAKGFDLLAMGRPEGAKCYCSVNNLLRVFLDSASKAYPYVVVDNEAGMEHLSRRTTNKVDDLLIVAEATAMGLRTAERVLKLASELPILVKRKRGVLSCARGAASAVAAKGFQAMGLELAASIPYDAVLYDIAAAGGSIFDVPDESPALQAVGALVRDYILAPAQAG